MITKSLQVFSKRSLRVGYKTLYDVNGTSLFIDIGNKCMDIIETGKLRFGDNNIKHVNCNTLLLRNYFSQSKQTNTEPIDQHAISFDIRTILHGEIKKSTTTTIQQNAKTQTTNNNNLYKDFISVYKENKARLERVSSQTPQLQIDGQSQGQSNIQQQIFDEAYVKKLVDMKYFYADVVNVASWLTEDLIVKMNARRETTLQHNGEIQTNTSQQQVSPKHPSPTHLHFLLYVYHLYPKQAKNFKDRMTILVNNFIDSQQFINLNVSQNMQFMFYLRKFIENQYYHKFSKHIQNINIKYTKTLQLSYIKHKQHQKQHATIESGQKQIGQKSQQMMLNGKMLHNYLLIFPNLWNTPKKSKNQQTQISQRHNQTTISKQVLQVYDFFVQQFNQMLKESIHYWLDQKKFNNEKNDVQMHKNFCQKKNLQDRFKQLQMKKVFDQLKLSLHRLTVVFDPPKIVHYTKRNNNGDNSKQTLKATNQKSSNSQQLQNFNNLSQQYLQSLVENYSQGQLNIINYLPSDKLTTQNDLLSLLIMIKTLLSYHVVRVVDNHIITNYLFNLFENNTHLINTNQPQLRKQIKLTIGEIVSKLASAGWVDKDDRLHKFLTPEIPHHKNSKITGKRDNLAQWFSEAKDY